MLGATCIDGNGKIVRKLYQWDVNQTLRADIKGYTFAVATAEVHFCNNTSELAKVVKAVVEGNIVSAAIPNSLLREAKTLFAYIYVTENETASRTILEINIPVMERKKPDDYLYTDDLGVVRLDAKIAEAEAIINRLNSVDVHALKIEVKTLGTDKFDKNCGVENTGKILAVGADGCVTPATEVADVNEVKTYLGI